MLFFGLGGCVRGLTDRRAECGVLDGLVQTVCAGESRVLVVHGEPGVGKTTLLDYLAARAAGCRVLWAVGVQSEIELAFAGLHQLCAPLLDRLEVLPGPQQEALQTASGPGSDAPPLLLKAARRLEPLDPGLARETYLDAWQAALFAGHLAVGGDLEEVSRAAQALSPPKRPPRAADVLLDGLALLVTDGPAAAPVLRQAISTFADPDVPVAERLRWSWMAQAGSLPLWDGEGWRLIVAPLQLARDVGALDQLPILLNIRAVAATWSGDLAAAASLIAEADAAREATGARMVAYAAIHRAATCASHCGGFERGLAR